MFQDYYKIIVSKPVQLQCTAVISLRAAVRSPLLEVSVGFRAHWLSRWVRAALAGRLAARDQLLDRQFQPFDRDTYNEERRLQKSGEFSNTF